MLAANSNPPKPFYITTAIDYANGQPHLGHAYEKVLADVVARTRALAGESVFFLTGLDEHGQKVQQSALKAGLSPQALCDQTAEVFQTLCRRLHISHNGYIRTTQSAHKSFVQAVLQDLYDRGHIYKAEYKGFYSVRMEQFVQEKDKVDGAWPELFGPVTELTESNYFFRIEPHQDWLIHYLQTHPEFVFPEFRLKQVIAFLKEPLNDLCISRPKERLSWGIPLPFDSDYVVYVWFDALLNYLSGATWGGRPNVWPADMHVIGKDILVPPHAIYWPIMLKAIGAALPKTLVVHGWWTLKGEKMSKSTGTAINPLDLIETYGPDAFRYYVMREMVIGQDSDFSVEQFQIRYQADLGNDLGNLVSRLLNMLHRYCQGRVPPAGSLEEPERELQKLWSSTCKEVLEAYHALRYHEGLAVAFRFLSALNRQIELRAPWNLAKAEDEASKALLASTLAVLAEGVRLSLLILSPVIPEAAARAYALLAGPLPTHWEKSLAWSDSLAGRVVGAQCVLFPRVS